MSTFRQAVAVRFSENLIRARERAGLSQEELGFRSSHHRTQIGVLERGARAPRIDTVLKLAGSLSIPPGELLSGMARAPGEFEPGELKLTQLAR